jgi:hypothetical protein
MMLGFAPSLSWRDYLNEDGTPHAEVRGVNRRAGLRVC